MMKENTINADSCNTIRHIVNRYRICKYPYKQIPPPELSADNFESLQYYIDDVVALLSSHEVDADDMTELGSAIGKNISKYEIDTHRLFERLGHTYNWKCDTWRFYSAVIAELTHLQIAEILLSINEVEQKSYEFNRSVYMLLGGLLSLGIDDIVEIMRFIPNDKRINILTLEGFSGSTLIYKILSHDACEPEHIHELLCNANQPDVLMAHKYPRCWNIEKNLFDNFITALKMIPIENRLQYVLGEKSYIAVLIDDINICSNYLPFVLNIIKLLTQEDKLKFINNLINQKLYSGERGNLLLRMMLNNVEFCRAILEILPVNKRSEILTNMSEKHDRDFYIKAFVLKRGDCFHLLLESWPEEQRYAICSLELTIYNDWGHIYINYTSVLYYLAANRHHESLQATLKLLPPKDRLNAVTGNGWKGKTGVSIFHDIILSNEIYNVITAILSKEEILSALNMSHRNENILSYYYRTPGELTKILHLYPKTSRVRLDALMHDIRCVDIPILLGMICRKDYENFDYKQHLCLSDTQYKVFSLVKSVVKAKDLYEKWYSAVKSIIEDSRESVWARAVTFLSEIPSGEKGQKRAKDFEAEIIGMLQDETFDNILTKLDNFFAREDIRFRKNSFATFVLKQLMVDHCDFSEERLPADGKYSRSLWQNIRHIISKQFHAQIDDTSSTKIEQFTLDSIAPGFT